LCPRKADWVRERLVLAACARDGDKGNENGRPWGRPSI